MVEPKDPGTLRVIALNEYAQRMLRRELLLDVDYGALPGHEVEVERLEDELEKIWDGTDEDGRNLMRWHSAAYARLCRAGAQGVVKPPPWLERDLTRERDREALAEFFGASDGG